MWSRERSWLKKVNRILDTVKKPGDIKKLTGSQLEVLAQELRTEILDAVSKNGGHLASNLGAVELTLAVCRALDLPKDKLIWDVGHQSYAFKLLTGRSLDNLRHMDGACGFCCPGESEYDFSVTGHSSASLSTAIGAVMANEIKGEEGRVCAVIGDGALTGGMAMEAIDHIGHLDKPILIILNDNEMSITKNVGGISRMLSKARSGMGYRRVKDRVESALKKLPGVYSTTRFVKEHIKYAITTAGAMFESLGVTYLGPVNGHNIKEMEELFRRALTMDEPVLVHVVTQKGRGYSYAEKAPEKYHGVSSFDLGAGVKEKNEKSYSTVFGETMCSLAASVPELAVITPSMTLGSGLIDFSRKYRDRFFDVGIAEGHAVTFGAGLAAGGAIPVISVYSSFLQRAYDNVIHDLAIADLHAVLAIDRAGLVPGDGSTHQGVFDVAFLSAIPNVTVLAPSCFDELRKMLIYAVCSHKGPIAVRYPRGGEDISFDNGVFIPGRAKTVRSGHNLTIAAYGGMVSRAVRCAGILEESGISAEVIDLRSVKPIDTAAVSRSIAKTGRLVFMEEVVRCGGIGEQLIANLSLRNRNVKTKLITLPDAFVPHASMEELEAYYGFTPEKLAESVTDWIKHHG